MQVGLIITSRNWKRLGPCCEALQAQSFDDFNVLLLDYDPKQSVSRDVQSSHLYQEGRIHTINAIDTTINQAWNLGINWIASRSNRNENLRYVGFLDDDSRPDVTWLQNVVSAAESSDEKVGMFAGRTWNGGIVSNNGRVGLFQFNEANWKASGTDIPWDNGNAAKDPQVAAEVALALLYRKLGYSGVDNPSEDAIRAAIDNFGEGDGRYGQAVMDCAKQLKAGNFVGAYGTLQTYANWVAGGRQ